MSDKQTYPLAMMEARANEILELLAPVVRRAEIWGSIRRRKLEVGDIEIGCEPLITEKPMGLFGDDSELINHEFEQMKLWEREGLFQHRVSKIGAPCCGPSFQRMLYKGIPVDLFGVIAPSQWGIVKLIRTGPASFSERFVTSRLYGGLMPPGMRQEGGFRLWDAPAGKYIEVPTEEAYFESVGLEWIAPGDRK